MQFGNAVKYIGKCTDTGDQECHRIDTKKTFVERKKESKIERKEE